MLRSALLEASSQFNMIVRNNEIQKVVLFKKVYIYIYVYIYNAFLIYQYTTL